MVGEEHPDKPLKRRLKKKINVYVDPTVKAVLSKYCKENETNISEIFRVLVQDFLLKSELLGDEEKELIRKIDPIDQRTARFSKYPVGIENNTDLSKLLEEINLRRNPQ